MGITHLYGAINIHMKSLIPWSLLSKMLTVHPPDCPWVWNMGLLWLEPEPGLYWQRGPTSYHKIAWSLEASKFSIVVRNSLTIYRQFSSSCMGESGVHPIVLSIWSQFIVIFQIMPGNLRLGGQMLTKAGSLLDLVDGDNKPYCFHITKLTVPARHPS